MNSRNRALALTTTVAAILIVSPSTVATAAAPEGLSVSIRDKLEEVKTGSELSYTIAVTNAGASPVDVRLVVTTPDYLTVTDAPGASTAGADATWTVTVPAGALVAETLTASVGAIPKGELRVTTLATVYLGESEQVAVRSADADRIAGVTDTAHAVSDSTVTPAPSTGWLPWVIGGSVLVIVLAGVLWWMLARRRAIGR